ncbi:hypothetical protein JOE56_001105 [Brevibacterium paucivorans]|uniref:DUF559 domain-containing protein n=1 Tax=Brevibacterium paucivorans TaxID=170994 RepID=A0ABS2SJI3_9MICO|nr:GTPase [Brevibacterium paucivorans]MBM7816411.1 hypothetical protein [Brevibacterium paucivorans]
MEHHTSRQRELAIPLKLSNAQALGLRQSDIKPVTLHGQKLHGVYTSKRHTQTITVPQWATENPLWWTLFTQLRAVTAGLPHAMVTGNSAAYLRGLPVKLRPQLDIAVPKRSGVIKRPGVNTFRVSNTASVEKAGLRVHDLGGILSIIARQEPVENLVTVLDAVLGPWRRPAEMTRAELQALINSLPRGPSLSTLKQACALAREKVASPQETRLRLALVRAGVPEPEVAPPVWIEKFGRFVHPDLAFSFAKLAIEYEGRHHFELTHQVLRDTERYYELSLLGWTVIRVTSLHSFDSVVAKVKDFLGL